MYNIIYNNIYNINSEITKIMIYKFKKAEMVEAPG